MYTETTTVGWLSQCSLDDTVVIQHKFSIVFLFFFRDSICFYCCWCLTLLDTFVIGEVRWEPQSCLTTNKARTATTFFLQRFSTDSHAFKKKNLSRRNGQKNCTNSFPQRRCYANVDIMLLYVCMYRVFFRMQILWH